MLKLLLLNWLYIIIFMVFVWGIYLVNKNPGIIDVFWSFIIMLTGLHYLFGMPYTTISIVFVVLLVLWAVRLAGYLFVTRIVPHHVDQRYVDLSDDWKGSKILGFLANFQLQGVLGIIIATPFLFIYQTQCFGVLQWVAALIIVLALIGEIVADYQLQRFRQHHKGKVCDVGLWCYSRHPNYFFEWLIWVGFALAGLTSAWGWIGFVSPLLLLFIMLKLTGPITEKGSIKSRGDAYREYQSKTSMFVPWLKRR